MSKKLKGTESTDALSASNDIAFYQEKCNTLSNQLSAFNNFLTQEQINKFDEVELVARLEYLNNTKDKYDSVHESLERLHITALHDELVSVVSDNYLRSKVKLNRALNLLKQANSVHSSTVRSIMCDETMPSQSNRRSRLPELKIPIFAGSYEEWPSFYSTFKSAIHNDQSMSNLEKMQYLITSLKGNALETVRSLETTDQNYDKALQILLNRFDNKILHFQAHIKAIYNLEAVGKHGALGLRKLSDRINGHLRALNTIATNEQVCDGLLIHLISHKLDKNTLEKWEENLDTQKAPTWEDMSTFLEKRCRALENMESATVTQTPSQQVGKIFNLKSNVFTTTFNTSQPSAECLFCHSKEHLIFKCPQFLSMSPNQRYKEAKNANLCINCLRNGHKIQECKSGACKKCKLKHHTLLHFEQSLPLSNFANSSSLQGSTQHSAMMAMSPSITNNPTRSYPNTVLLATAVVFIKNRLGTFVPCRALLDSGSQLHFITTRFAQQLQLQKSKTSTIVTGIGDADFATDGHSVNLTLKSRTSSFTTNFNAVVTRSITERQPTYPVITTNWKIPSNIQLADPNFNKPQRIDLLIGAGLFFELLCIGQIQLSPGLPLLQKTILGWIVSGGKHSDPKHSALVAFRRSCNNDIAVDKLDELVSKFWETDHVFETTTKNSKEDLDCEAHFKNNVSRQPSGEYSVRLPTKIDISKLGESYSTALRRFENLEHKLRKNMDLYDKYRSFINEYEKLSHMSLVSSTDVNKCKYFLSHHCVFKEDSTTTKLRVVFDGSAATRSGLSLNDILMTGPTIQPKLFSTLLRFRTYPIALKGDICKMYRCVKVTAPDNTLQCILWRDSPKDELKIYKLDTVTYGTKPASFLAIRSMHQLALDEGALYPTGSKTILRDFYVDDMISGGNTVSEVRVIKQQTTDLLALGHFKLRKWYSNNKDILNDIPDLEREILIKFEDNTNITKTLGIAWEPLKDTLLFFFTPYDKQPKNTKRSVLATIARFYDPLGLIGPTLTKAKIFMQNMWRNKLQWDESLPQSLDTAWSALSNDLENVKHLTFPRFALKADGAVEIYAFCDASLEAYGACVYARSCKNEEVNVQLLCSKSRVAPLKTITIPKLELCAAVLLAQLLSEIVKLNIFNCQFHCWSDSSVVLSWIQEESSKFNVFIANRICAVQELTCGMHWHHVPTAFNPADILSKGASPTELASSSCWINGPDFLKGPRSEWPAPCFPVHNLPEIRKKVLLSSISKADRSFEFKYINSFAMMRRIFGYVHKFITSSKSSQLSADNIKHVTHILLRIVQRGNFSQDYKLLSAGKCISAASNLASLSTFIDIEGLIRVGGRLRNSTLGFEARHPIVLPRDYPLTFAIIMYSHRKLLHAGPQALLASLRTQYWPIGGRKTVAQALHKCIICCRAKPRMVEHIMADLPKERIQASRPFLITGVDYCGPFYYKTEVRNKAPQKCYVSVFICFATKAVWMELVKDLSAAAFIGALKRFVATRGRPLCIWSDNATNFTGAKNELRELRNTFLNQRHCSEIYTYCLNDGFDWKFIPPRSPHFGGLWESAVKTAKHHFYRVVRTSILGFDELRTLICQITAIINSRPLVPISENPNDLDVLTPSHFLIGGPPMEHVEPDVTSLNYNRLDRWQRVTYLQQVFWKRWSEEYLTLLQQRGKWRKPHSNIQVNDVVCVKDECLPPLKWPLARVIETIPGKDGVVRVAVLRTPSGTTHRAINKLCVLPVKDSVEGLDPSKGGVCSESQQ